MFKAKKILLFPTKSQKAKIDAQIEEHRLLYNNCLGLKKETWETEQKNISVFDLIKSEVKKFKKTSNYSALQQTVRRLDKSYKNFFRRAKLKQGPAGFPRFKNKDRFRTIEYGAYGDGNKIRNNCLYLLNVGQIKCSSHDFPSNIKTTLITRIADRYYVSFIYDDTEAVQVNQTNRSVGIDLGVKTFIATSDGEKVESPKFHKQGLKQLSKAHRKIHEQPLGSTQRKKRKIVLAKIHNKIANRRKDFNHKLSRKIVDKYDTIVIEDISPLDFDSEIKNINRAYRDVAWGQLKTFLNYKAENAGKRIIKVNPAYTTQECSYCGHIAVKSLKDRIHLCSKCGYEEDRDINAAKNILRRGLSSLGS